MAVYLDQSPLTSKSYNALPHVDSCNIHSIEVQHALKALLSVIKRYRLDQFVSVHLIHKHFDLQEDKVMVYETVTGPNHPDFLLSSPRDPRKCTNLRGLYFKAEGGNLVAYEFTTDKGTDISEQKDFLADFHATIVDYGVEDVFALTVKTPDGAKLTELELPEYSSTILVNDPPWFQPSEDAMVTFTDWPAPAADLKDGLPCTSVQKCVWDINRKHWKGEDKLGSTFDTFFSSKSQQMCFLDKQGKHTKIDEGHEKSLDKSDQLREAGAPESINAAGNSNGEVDGQNTEWSDKSKETTSTSVVRCVLDSEDRHWEWDDKLKHDSELLESGQQACWKDNYGRHVLRDTENSYVGDHAMPGMHNEQSAILQHALSLLTTAR